MICRKSIVSLLLVVGALFDRTAAGARSADLADLPDGFAQQVVAAGITGATGMAIAGDGRIFVAEQTGTLRLIKDGSLLKEPFLKLEVDSAWERGLIGLTLDPNFPKAPFIYLCYVTPKPYPHHRVSRFTCDGDRAKPDSEVVLLEGDDQTKLGGVVPAGHQGGGIHFGRDGKLYIAIGEQTAGEPSQSLHTLQGKLLRINSDGSIPDDNPFAQKTQGKYRAIWAYGLRNPFGFAVQPGTGRIFINDVGDSRWEEVNEGVAGANYGWPRAEGPTLDSHYRSPIHFYGASAMKSVSGGVFYNPSHEQFPHHYVGKYFFADFNLNWIHVLDPESPASVETFATRLTGPVDLQLGSDGSLYCLNRNAWVKDQGFRPNTGSLLRIFHVAGSKTPAPALLVQPSDVTVIEGDRAVFHMEAKAEGPIHFHWERNGQPINSAEGPDYIIERVSAKDDGSRFQCVVSNPKGTLKSRAASLWLASPRQSPAPRPMQSGLEYEAHQGHWAALPPFTHETRVASGAARSVNADLRPREENFALTFRGFIEIDRRGAYTFEVEGSGTAKLYVASAEVLTLVPEIGPRRCAGTIGLEAGRHPIRLDYAQGQKDSPPRLVLRYAGPGLSLGPVPPEKLFRIDRTDPRETTISQGPKERPLSSTVIVSQDIESMPRLLSQTGLFRSLDELSPAAGVIPYQVNSPLWSDGAGKRRWVVFPGDAHVRFASTGFWKFPEKTVFVKHFELGSARNSSEGARGRRLETRLLVVDRAGQGFGVTYRWHPDQRDAKLLSDGLTEEISWETSKGKQTQTWTYPSRNDCLACHTPQAGFVLGVNTRQLNGPSCQPGSPTEDNQLQAWSRAGLFETPVPEQQFAALPRLAPVGEESATLEHRARSYLDTNCAHCHRPGGARAEFDARYEASWDIHRLTLGSPNATDLGIPNARIVAPGDRTRSLLYRRMERRGNVFSMPPLASHRVDTKALEVIGRWIDSLGNPTATAQPKSSSRSKDPS